MHLHTRVKKTQENDYENPLEKNMSNLFHSPSHALNVHSRNLYGGKWYEMQCSAIVNCEFHWADLRPKNFNLFTIEIRPKNEHVQCEPRQMEGTFFGQIKGQ